MTARVDALRPADLTAAQRELYDRILDSARATGPRPFPLADEEGRLRGPFNGMLLSPELGHALQELGTVVRYGTGFTRREKELAILAVAAREHSEYEWAVHTHAALEAGVTEEQIAAIRAGDTCALDDPLEDAVLATARELAASGDLSDDAFAAATGTLGLTRLYELVTLVGYYRLVAGQLRVLRVGP
ncbi:carboxymuconolactone decarboxylase family protein [Actinomadura darangshiensis]|uniref:Carboxymuconolactone decarboxylase family protein n=1 Tax=Actinomadura darangshiensis TaxID=705336 RepID=A0A4R5BSD0_9ACTN|nr:carboxymuconolactone decarboxylase family protein [Actinomadura darangshiensis]TDD88476.1 carboxymuconolactone decarboxylase family protein [Actinomadura darangshiensis]